MHKPKTPEDLENEIYSSVNKLSQIGNLRVRQLIKVISDTNDEIIIEGILKVFEGKNNRLTIYEDQKNAGLILKTLNPKTKMSAESILHRVLENWNKSVEELPFWLRQNYGNETLKRTIIAIENQKLSTIEEDKLQTLKWWLGIKI